MKHFMLLFHTIRFLKVKQLFYQVYYRLRKPRYYNLPDPKLREALTNWSGAAFISPATINGDTFTFLGETGDLQKGWNNPELSKLWLYNLHYQDDLNAVGSTNHPDLCKQLIDNWISENPPFDGNGWEPYCLSLRIVNWVKWFSCLHPYEIQPHWLHSLACQANALEQQLEFHILANHLFANAKALVFVGSYIGGAQGDIWLKKGLNLLDQEVPEQFLADGGNYELSPMYHASLIWDLCDLLQLQQQAQLGVLAAREKLWRPVIKEGITWLRKMVHPDGDIAFFNDATLGIAPTLKDLEAYARQLNCLPELAISSTGSLLQLHHLKSSGYLIIDWSDKHRALLDVALVGPDHQPGHAHADTLSFELSLFGQRVFVNSGISQYGEDMERQRQRSTAAHNTLEVDGENSSEVWAGFRVARRARPFDLKVQVQHTENQVTASHDGYQRLTGKVTHQRKWVAKQDELVVEDRLLGRFTKAVAYFHLHPDVELEQLDDNCWRGRLPKGQVFNVQIEGGVVKQQAGSWHPAFGISLPNYCLVASVQTSELRTCISWSKI